MTGVFVELDLFTMGREMGVPVEFRTACLMLTILLTFIPLRLASREEED